MAKDLPKMPKGHAHQLEKKLATPVKPLKKRVLTPKQWKFVQELVMGDGQVTMAEAAIRAGWPAKSAKESARLLTNPDKNPHVVAAIQELRKDMAERFGTTMERHMRDLQNIRDLALQAGAYGAAVQAEYRRGQALGTIYIDRKEIRHGTIDSMSKDEVMRKLEELKRLYGDPGKIIDITPNQLEEAKDIKPAAPQLTAGEILIEVTRKANDADSAREQALSQIEGKPTRLPYNTD
jgi:phage terminase small subunit